MMGDIMMSPTAWQQQQQQQQRGADDSSRLSSPSSIPFTALA